MLTTKEAARILFVGRPAVRRYIREGLGKKGEKEKLKATKLKHGAREEWGIKYVDLDFFRKKYLM